MLSRAGIIVCLFSHRTPGPVLLAGLPGFSAVTQSIYLCCVLLFYILLCTQNITQSRSICDDSIENACQVICTFQLSSDIKTFFNFFPQTGLTIKKSSDLSCLRRIFFDGRIVKMTVKEIYSTK